MYELKIVTRFAAAHQLPLAAKKCENLHGHNWRIEAYVAGPALDENGLLIDFGEIKNRVKAILTRLDHTFLNEIEAFEGKPSSENIARYIAEELASQIDGESLRVVRVAAWESEDACATYYPPDRAAAAGS